MQQTQFLPHLHVAQNQVWTNQWMWREADQLLWTTPYLPREELLEQLRDIYGLSVVTLFLSDGPNWKRDWMVLW